MEIKLIILKNLHGIKKLVLKLMNKKKEKKGKVAEPEEKTNSRIDNKINDKY